MLTMEWEIKKKDENVFDDYSTIRKESANNEKRQCRRRSNILVGTFSFTRISASPLITAAEKKPFSFTFNQKCSRSGAFTHLAVICFRHR